MGFSVWEQLAKALPVLVSLEFASSFQKVKMGNRLGETRFQSTQGCNKLPKNLTFPLHKIFTDIDKMVLRIVMHRIVYCFISLF